MAANAYTPYFDPEYETLIERLHPPRICIDNDACSGCTLVKVDSKNKNGILLEMVQVLSDLDLVISKSYICSDGSWFMDVFHVTDQLGKKVTDEGLILYIKQALCATRKKGGIREVKPPHVSTEHTALEITGTDRPGLLSEISAVLAELNYLVTAAAAWTHKTRSACILYVEDETSRGPITDPIRTAQISEQLDNVVKAHHVDGESRSVRLIAPVAGQTHTERRLHQLMAADKDYESCSSCRCSVGDDGGDVRNGWRENRHRQDCFKTYVSIDWCRERDYSVVNIKSRDRPKLLFDTVCTLTDLQYIVFHAAISCKNSIATQEYYIRRKDGCTLDSGDERCKVTQCLVAAVDRRASHGLRLEIATQNRLGLLSDITRVFRENGLSISRVEIGTRGETAVGSFYVTDASGNDVDLNTIEMIKKEIGGTVLVVNQLGGWGSPAPGSLRSSRTTSGEFEEKPKFSLGSLLWSQLERLSSNMSLP